MKSSTSEYDKNNVNSLRKLIRYQDDKKLFSWPNVDRSKSMSPSVSTKIEDKCSDLEIKIGLLIIMINGITEYSLIEGDLGNHQTEIDFGSVMRNLTFDQSLTRVYRPI